MPSISLPYPVTQRLLHQPSANGGLPLVLSHDAPLHPLSPPLASGELLVRTEAVALNPTDYKMAQNFNTPDCVAGCDFAGVVVASGSSSDNIEGAIRIGDHVCGAVHGNNPLRPTDGAFAEYIRCEADLLVKIPKGKMSWEDAAALGGIGHATCGLALWDALGLVIPARLKEGDSVGDAGDIKDADVNDEIKKQYVLVYGGSTATGTMALQLLSL